MKKISLSICLSVMLTGMLLISCGNKKENDETVKIDEPVKKSDSEEASKTPTAQATSDTEKENEVLSFKKEEDMKKIIEEIQKKFGGKSIKMLNIHFYDDGRVVFDAQDPEKPDNVDHYVFANGTWEPAQPVKLMGNGKLEDNIFRLDEVNLLAIPGLVKEAEEKTKDLEGGKIEHVYAILTVVRKNSDDKVTIYVPVQGTRRNKTLMADGKGIVKRFD